MNIKQKDMLAGKLCNKIDDAVEFSIQFDNIGIVMLNKQQASKLFLSIEIIFTICNP